MGVLLQICCFWYLNKPATESWYSQIFESIISKKIEENTSVDFEALKHHYQYIVSKRPIEKTYLKANL